MENSKLCEMHMQRAQRRARILLLVVATVAVAGFSALFVYLTYRPVNPQFSVARAALYQLESAGASGNSSSSWSSSASAGERYAIAARAQFTLLLHNPSERVSVHYGGLLAYVTYHGEPAAAPVEIPAVVQERGADVSLSLLFGGGGGAEPVAVSEGTVRALAADCAARRPVLLRIVILGQVRYESGLFSTAWRDLFVRCDVTTGVGADAAQAGGVPLVEYPRCFVDA
ncbi:unnamed protein product [Urochloa humidicola]